MSLCAVFCIADMPSKVLNAFVERSEQFLKAEYPFFHDTRVEDHFVIITSTDDIPDEGAPLPVQSFKSPFLGKTVKEVRDWFDINITQDEEFDISYMPYCFIILDERSIQDETCLFVSTDVEDAPFKSIRGDFYVGYHVAIQCTEKQSIEEDYIGFFLRSGMVMTRELKKLALDDGLYIEGGEVKIDQEFRDLMEKYSM
ncbi:hypothetical protein NLJ89_g9173 [Agrocybe chaxingu]|uniref:Uncharacterized protein n=1 Tax=Agrocybe chaxingu TaxID=84603 RepID=A0A9W8MTD6_9AGAR|nr:hypothetical protein NLJ89_g9173 [Agrocybe chaxingu]